MEINKEEDDIWSTSIALSIAQDDEEVLTKIQNNEYTDRDEYDKNSEIQSIISAFINSTYLKDSLQPFDINTNFPMYSTVLSEPQVIYPMCYSNIQLKYQIWSNCTN